MLGGEQVIGQEPMGLAVVAGITGPALVLGGAFGWQRVRKRYEARPFPQVGRNLWTQTALYLYFSIFPTMCEDQRWSGSASSTVLVDVFC